jgi:hypothetical protein
MDKRLLWEPPAEEGNSYESYRLLLKPLTADDHWEQIADSPSFLKDTDELAEELLELNGVPMQFPAIVKPEQAMAFSRAVTILTSRSDLLAAQGKKSDAIQAVIGALVLTRKIIEGKGTIGLYMHGVACEVRTLNAAKRRLLSNLYRGPTTLFDHFPDHRRNNEHLAESYRTEYQWVLGTTPAPIEDLLVDPLQIDWWGADVGTNLAPWPKGIDRSFIDDAKTVAGFKEMIAAEVDFYEKNLRDRPRFDHLWSDLPPRARNRDVAAIERFDRAIRSIDNPIGKTSLRNASISYNLIWNISKARVSRLRKARFWTTMFAQRSLT